MHELTQRKFDQFPDERKHKKCAELLRCIYSKQAPELLERYNKWASWLSLSPLIFDLKLISDRFHYHLHLSHQFLAEHNLLPVISKNDKVVSQPLWPIAIYLDHIRSAHNVGSIIRTVEAFALGAIHFSSDTPFVDNKQVQNTSMETYKWVKASQGTLLTHLPKPIIALETCDQAVNLYDYLFPESFTLVLGNEEYGCSQEVLNQADVILQIPLRGRKNSLNVANAFAIAAAFIAQQRSV